MMITKQAYLAHKNGRRDFPTFEQYVANSEAARDCQAKFNQRVASVVVEYGQTIGQIFTANSHVSRNVVEAAVFGKYEVIGYRAGYEVYGNKK